MHARTRIRTPLPPRPAVASVAVDSTHRLLAALVDRDLGGAEALFAPSACVWWSRSSPSGKGAGLSSVEGASTLARALADLLEREPPTGLSVVGSSPRTTVTSAYLDDQLAWSIELRIEDARIVGGLLRGTDLPTH